MPYWYHKIIRRVVGNKIVYRIREVFCKDDGSIFMHTSAPIDLYGEGNEALSAYINGLSCPNSPMLIDGEVELDLQYRKDVQDE